MTATPDARLPAWIRDAAHVAGNGELMWPRPGAIDAAEWLAQNGMAIWGGEVYTGRGPFMAVMVGEWRTEPELERNEEWHTYIQRGLAQALAAITNHPLDSGAEAAGRTFYFLSYHSAAGFPGEARRIGSDHD
ncbi:MAG: hypothetical protein ACR2MY_07470 [Candidatus Dormibacteria bacterium]